MDEPINFAEEEQTNPKKKEIFAKRHKKLLIFLGVLAAIGIAVAIAALADGIKGIQTLGNFITDQILGMK